MADRGYKVDHVPPDSRALMDDLLATATNDRRFLTDEQIEQAAGKVSAAEYRQWFDRLEPETREQLTKDWGLPPGDVFNYDGHLLVPGMLNGNIFITVQPPRGSAKIRGSSTILRIVRRPTIIWPITIGYGISGKRMPWCM